MSRLEKNMVFLFIMFFVVSCGGDGDNRGHQYVNKKELHVETRVECVERLLKDVKNNLTELEIMRGKWSSKDIKLITTYTKKIDEITALMEIKCMKLL